MLYITDRLDLRWLASPDLRITISNSSMKDAKCVIAEMGTLGFKSGLKSPESAEILSASLGEVIKPNKEKLLMTSGDEIIVGYIGKARFEDLKKHRISKLYSRPLVTPPDFDITWFHVSIFKR